MRGLCLGHAQSFVGEGSCCTNTDPCLSLDVWPRPTTLTDPAHYWVPQGPPTVFWVNFFMEISHRVFRSAAHNHSTEYSTILQSPTLFSNALQLWIHLNSLLNAPMISIYSVIPEVLTEGSAMANSLILHPPGNKLLNSTPTFIHE